MEAEKCTLATAYDAHLISAYVRRATSACRGSLLAANGSRTVAESYDCRLFGFHIIYCYSNSQLDTHSIAILYVNLAGLVWVAESNKTLMAGFVQFATRKVNVPIYTVSVQLAEKCNNTIQLPREIPLIESANKLPLHACMWSWLSAHVKSSSVCGN